MQTWERADCGAAKPRGSKDEPRRFPRSLWGDCSRSLLIGLGLGGGVDPGGCRARKPLVRGTHNPPRFYWAGAAAVSVARGTGTRGGELRTRSGGCPGAGHGSVRQQRGLRAAPATPVGCWLMGALSSSPSVRLGTRSRDSAAGLTACERGRGGAADSPRFPELTPHPAQRVLAPPRPCGIECPCGRVHTGARAFLRARVGTRVCGAGGLSAASPWPTPASPPRGSWRCSPAGRSREEERERGA